MKPDRIQIAPELGNGQGTTFMHQVVKRFPVKSLCQATILASVFADLIKDTQVQLVAMVVEPHQLTLIVGAAGGGPLTAAEYDVIDTFDVVYEMGWDSQEEEDDSDDSVIT